VNEVITHFEKEISHFQSIHQGVDVLVQDILYQFLHIKQEEEKRNKKVTQIVDDLNTPKLRSS
jgi:hypothetical protein